MQNGWLFNQDESLPKLIIKAFITRHAAGATSIYERLYSLRFIIKYGIDIVNEKEKIK